MVIREQRSYAVLSPVCNVHRSGPSRFPRPERASLPVFWRTMALCPEDLSRRLAELHDQFQRQYPALCRIAVAVYDNESDLLKTFVHSTRGASPLRLYEAKLSDVPSLQALAETGLSRVIPDLAVLPGSLSHHTQAIRETPYRSSYTVPIRQGATLHGFLFFNATEPGFFNERVVASLDIYAQLISLLVINEILPINTLKGAVQAARVFSRHRDDETGQHLERMARYARLIAWVLAPRHDLEDWWVEYVYRFAPLHDVGKVAIPDAVLLKPGRLTSEELRVMRTHVAKGTEIIDAMIQSFGLETVPHVSILRNIVTYHHEALDGTGYPHGLTGSAIPLEARITAIADVFDALTSKRPYKGAWSNEEAAAYLREHAGVRFDAEAVEALLSCPNEIQAIQARYREDPLG